VGYRLYYKDNVMDVIETISKLENVLDVRLKRFEEVGYKCDREIRFDIVSNSILQQKTLYYLGCFCNAIIVHNFDYSTITLPSEKVDEYFDSGYIHYLIAHEIAHCIDRVKKGISWTETINVAESHGNSFCKIMTDAGYDPPIRDFKGG
jgi:hypothetical protein